MMQGEVRGKSYMAYGMCLYGCFDSLMNGPCFGHAGL